MVKLRIKNETKDDKFKRIAESRVNKLLKQFEILRNCSNTQVYSYSDAQTAKIFKAIDDEVRLTKAAFQSQKKTNKGIRL
jgi:hypothetical protein